MRTPILAVMALGCLVMSVVSGCGTDAEERGSAQGSGKPGIAVTISRETTYITEPLREDGYPDYPAVLNERASKGVTAENNVIVPLFEALGPTLVENKDRERFFKLLGTAPPPDKGDYFVEFYEYLKAHVPEAVDEKNFPSRWYKEETRASGPWSKEDCPLMMEWLAASEKPLTRVIEASRRAHFYAPTLAQVHVYAMTASSDGKSNTPNPFPLASSFRSVMRALRHRAMLRITENNPEGAWTDLYACHRLGRLLAQGPGTMGYLVGSTLESVACDGYWKLAHFCRLTPEHASKWAADLNRLPPLPPTAEQFDLSERFDYLDTVCALAQGTAKPSDLFGKSVEKRVTEWVNTGLVDWDQVLRLGNEYFDKIVRALRKPTWSEREVGLIALEKELKQLRAKYEKADAGSSADSTAAADRRTFVTQAVSATLASWCSPPRNALVVERRTIIDIGLSEVALALGAYRTDNDHYPDELGPLVPKYLKRLPEDPYGKGTFCYRRDDDGYLLYSVGPNGKDDTGPKPRNYTYSSTDPRPSWLDSDDIGIRMPDRSEENP